MDDKNQNGSDVKQMPLCLCFYGDSALWDNILHIPEYPSGYSYFRPFRYRDKWIQKSLLDEMSNEQSLVKLIGSNVVLCMRFLDSKYKWKILPIRQAVIRHIDPMSDNQSVEFSMGILYDFTEVKALNDACMEISQSDQANIGETLFFRAESDITGKLCANEASEDNSWISFVDLIAHDTTFPIKEEAKHSLFIRFRGLGRDKLTERACIHKSWSSGQIQGAVLSEGASYELVFFHRVPILITKHVSIEKSVIKYNVPSGNLELSHSEEELTGNYQKHVLSISANKPTGTWEEIIIEFPEHVKSQEGMTINTANSRLPLKVKISHWYRFLRTYLWVFIIWASLSINVVIDNLLEGKTDWKLIIVSAVIAVFSAIGVFMLKQKNPTK